MLKKRYVVLSFILTSCLLILTGLICLEKSALAAVGPQVIAQGYLSNSLLSDGTIVQLSTKDPATVTPLSTANTSKMLGVVIPQSEALITMGQENVSKQVFVTNSGIEDVLVSTQNGPIRSGDYITVSGLPGIGMKADSSEQTVLGQAVGNFNGIYHAIRTYTVSISGGHKIKVRVGLVPVSIAIANNPLAFGIQGVPSFISGIIEKITNSNSVSSNRAYIAILIVVLGTIVTITVIYSAVKNSVVSLGRNPLAKKIIGRNFIRLLAVSVLILIISLGVAYAVLV